MNIDLIELNKHNFNKQIHKHKGQTKKQTRGGKNQGEKKGWKDSPMNWIEGQSSTKLEKLFELAQRLERNK